MPGFDMSGYVDVAERERLLFNRYPDARIQVDLEDVRDSEGELVAWKAKATLWRTPDDPLPVCDYAVEPVPGKTPYTKDSEAMNASTSAVGRAIVLAGFETKKIASAEEVRNRQGAEKADDGMAPTGPQKRKLGVLIRELGILEERQDWSQVGRDFIEEKFGKKSTKDLTKQEMSALIDHMSETKDALTEDVPLDEPGVFVPDETWYLEAEREEDDAERERERQDRKWEHGAPPHSKPRKLGEANGREALK